MTFIKCDWCDAVLEWNRFFDTYYCPDCRSDDCTEVEDEQD